MRVCRAVNSKFIFLLAPPLPTCEVVINAAENTKHGIICNKWFEPSVVVAVRRV